MHRLWFILKLQSKRGSNIFRYYSLSLNEDNEDYSKCERLILAANLSSGWIIIFLHMLPKNVVMPTRNNKHVSLSLIQFPDIVAGERQSEVYKKSLIKYKLQTLEKVDTDT